MDRLAADDRGGPWAGPSLGEVETRRHAGRTEHLESWADEVIRQANNTRYGLAAYVFTNDLTTAFKMAEGIEAGIIGINDPVPAAPQCPFGGMKESGLGRELAHEGLEAYLETKYVAIKLRE